MYSYNPVRLIYKLFKGINILLGRRLIYTLAFSDCKYSNSTPQPLYLVHVLVCQLNTQCASRNKSMHRAVGCCLCIKVLAVTKANRFLLGRRLIYVFKLPYYALTFSDCKYSNSLLQPLFLLFLFVSNQTRSKQMNRAVVC